MAIVQPSPPQGDMLRRRGARIMILETSWAARALRTSRLLLVFALIPIGCGDLDRCLDRDGRWNEVAKACEFDPGPLEDAAAASTAGLKTLRFSYGEQVEDQAPFHAELDEGIWHVFGSLSEGSLGGVAHVWLDAQTGKVVRMVHEQ
jgi:hypothetical protein